MQTFHSNWGSYLRYDGEEKPDIDRALLKRVWSYGKPYRRQLIGVIVTVLMISSLSVLPPILTRRLIDVALPNKDLGQLSLLGLGIVAFGVDTAAGLVFAKGLNRVSGGTFNPLIGAAGISAFPMAARVVQRVAQEEDFENFPLMHAMGANAAGQVASTVAGGVLLALVAGASL